MKMDSIRLNSVPQSAFASDGSEYGNLVGAGRVVMYEANVRETQALHKAKNRNCSLESMMAPHNLEYAAESETHKQRVLMFCAKQAATQIGKTAPATYEEFIRCQRDYQKDPTFLRTLAGITTEVIRPMLPYVISNAMDRLAKTVNIPIGTTYELDVMSNDIFRFQDSSWGAAGSVPANTLNNYPITLNPTPKTAKASAKWHQLIGNNADIGIWYNAMAQGMLAYVQGSFAKVLVAASTNTFFVPQYLQFSTMNDSNFAKAAKLVANVNHVDRKNSVFAYADFEALSRLLPDTGVATMDAALSYQLGLEYNNNGFLGSKLGVGLVELQNTIVPGTQNSGASAIETLPTDELWMFAMVGGDAPIYIGTEDGTPVTLVLTPDKSRDDTIDIEMTMCIDVVPVIAKKGAHFTNV